MITLREIVAYLELDPELIVKLPSGGTNLRHEFDVSPETFLERAEQDYEAGGTAASLNAVTNAKRAVNGQIDRVLACFGYNYKHVKLPEKIRLLGEMGFVAPRILRKLATSRNMLEHEYEAPSNEEIEDALDLANLFVEAANRHLSMFEDEFFVSNGPDVIDNDQALNELHFSYHQEPDPWSPLPYVFRLWSQKRARNTLAITRTDEIVVTNKDVIFPNLVAFVTSGDNESRLRKAALALFGKLGYAGPTRPLEQGQGPRLLK